jgi:hypothetical protein
MVLDIDTPASIEALQLELFRKASPARRFALMSSFSSTLRKASLRQLEERLDPLAARLEWVRLHYGEALANSLQGKLQVSRSPVNETEETLKKLVSVFNQLNISYRIVGSVASSVQGMMRATLDIDIVAAVDAKHISLLNTNLENDYYLDEELLREAVKRGSSFNLIHKDTLIKVDIFVLGQRPYDRVSFERERQDTIDDLTLSFKTPEDVILGKLEWFVHTDKTSDRQWRDIVGLLKVQGDTLDVIYMRTWATELGVLALLEQALKSLES